jgi:hypothetical protein
MAWFGKKAMTFGEGGSIPFMGMLGARFPYAQFLITGVLGPAEQRSRTERVPPYPDGEEPHRERREGAGGPDEERLTAVIIRASAGPVSSGDRRLQQAATGGATDSWNPRLRPFAFGNRAGRSAQERQRDVVEPNQIIAVGRLVAAVFLSCGLAVTAEARDAGPRPVSAAEAAAVEIVADFLARGPAAFQERLAGDGGLAALRARDAVAEIEVRTGPPAGARWTLQAVAPSLAERVAVFGVEFPSGLDDVVEVELVERDGRYLVFDLRSHAEPSPRGIRLPWREDAGRDDGAPPPGMRRFVLPGLMILAFSIFVLTAMRMNVTAGRVSGVVSIVACCGLVWLVSRDVRARRS